MGKQSERIIAGLVIFHKYDAFWLAAEHDEIFAGPDPAVVSPEDLAELRELGWYPSEYESFHHFV